MALPAARRKMFERREDRERLRERKIERDRGSKIESEKVRER